MTSSSTQISCIRSNGCYSFIGLPNSPCDNYKSSAQGCNIIAAAPTPCVTFPICGSGITGDCLRLCDGTTNGDTLVWNSVTNSWQFGTGAAGCVAITTNTDAGAAVTVGCTGDLVTGANSNTVMQTSGAGSTVTTRLLPATCDHTILQWNDQTQNWLQMDPPSATVVTAGGTGMYPSVSAALLASPCKPYVRVVGPTAGDTDVSLSTAMSLAVVPGILIYVDPGQTWAPVLSSSVDVNGNSLTILGGGASSVVDLSAGTLGVTSIVNFSNLNLQNVSINTQGPIADPALPLSVQHVTANLPNLAGPSFIGTNAATTLAATTLTDVTINANGAGTNAEVIVGTSAAAGQGTILNGVWLRGTTVGTPINLTGPNVLMTDVLISSVWSFLLASVQLVNLQMSTATSTCDITITGSCSLDTIRATSLTCSGADNNVANVVLSGTLTVNSTSRSIYSQIEAATANIAQANGSAVTITNSSFHNIYVTGNIRVCDSITAFSASVSSCDFSNLHSTGGTISFCTSRTATGLTAVITSIQVSNISASAILIASAALAGQAVQLTVSSFSNLAATNSFDICQTLGTGVATLTGSQFTGLVAQSNASVFSIGSQFAGSTMNHASNMYSNLRIFGGDPTLKLSTFTSGGLNVFSNAYIAGNFIANNTRYNTWNNVFAENAIRIGPVEKEIFSNITAVGTGLTCNIGGVGTGGITNSRFTNFQTQEGVGSTAVIGTNTGPVSSSQFSNFRVVGLSMNNIANSVFENFYVNDLAIGSNTTCFNSFFTDFQVATNTPVLYGLLTDCSLIAHNHAQGGFVSSQIQFGGVGTPMRNCNVVNFRQIHSSLPGGPALTTVVNATQNRFTNCDFDVFAINASAGAIVNDDNAFENLEVVRLAISTATDNRFTNLAVYPDLAAITTTTIAGDRTQVTNSRFFPFNGAHNVTVTGVNCGFSNNILGSSGAFSGTLTLPVGSGSAVGNHATVVGGLVAATGLNTGAW